MVKVYNKRTIEGVTIPAIIHNSGYYYIDMPIYEDGSMDCWERISLSELSLKLEKNWLVAEIPTGKNIGIHGLGNYKISKSTWEYTKQSFEKNVIQTIKKLNSNMAGIFEKTTEQLERWDKHRVSFSASGIPFKLNGGFGYEYSDGLSTKILYKTENIWQLTTIIVYKDGNISVDAVPDRVFTLDEIRELFASNNLSTDPEGMITISIPGLGVIECKSEYNVYSSEKLKEIEDMLQTISGKPSLHEECKKRYFDYLVYPCDRNKERLKTAYEAIPEHERMYLGDMDSKDGDYTRILYTKEKREV